MKERVEYYPNGTIKKRYQVNHKGEKHGAYKSWHSNGKLRVDCTCVNKKLHGTFNGNLFMECIYLNDDICGINKDYNINGQI